MSPESLLSCSHYASNDYSQRKSAHSCDRDWRARGYSDNSILWAGRRDLLMGEIPMSSKTAAGSIVYLAIFLQLATYIAQDAGWLSEGGLYWTLLYASTIAALGAVIWILRLQRSR